MDVVGVVTMVIIVFVVVFSAALFLATSRLEKEIQDEIDGKGDHEIRSL
jgi:hypothetical protein